MENSKFQFKGFSIARSLIERKDDKPNKNFSINFDPKGVINKKKSNFQLNLGVNIEDEDKTVKIEILAIADFIFDKDVEINELDNFFYVNSTAILFPYIRAYISTLTNLSGMKPITIPTLNLTKLGGKLKKNTQELTPNKPNDSITE